MEKNPEPVISFLIDEKGIITLSGNFDLKKLGLKQSPGIGQSIFDLYDDSPSVVENIQRALRGECITTETSFNGSVFSNCYSPLFDAQGKVKQVIGTSFDITEEKKKEETVRENEFRLRMLFNSADDAIFTMDNRTFIDCNPATLRIFQCTKEQIVGQTPYRFSPELQPDGRTSEESAIEKINAVLNGKPQFFEWRHIHFDGTPFDAEVSLNRLDLDNEVLIQAMVRDVSARKRAEEENKRLAQALLDRNDDLIKINAELDRFVYCASHDLRAPIASLLGLIEVARMEKNEASRGLLLDMQKKSLLRLDRFINDIVDHSRNTRLEVESEPVHFEQSINSILEQLQFMDNVSKIRKAISVEQKTEFYTSATRVELIFNNLISNAIKYADIFKADPLLDIEVISNESSAKIFVRDNGEGIPLEAQSKIFDMFFRASSRGSGSGLGLYIVKEAIEKIGGIIQVRSEFGKGTEFSVEIPNEIKRAKQSLTSISDQKQSTSVTK